MNSVSRGHEFYNALLCTIQEADDFEFDEKLFRAWTANDAIGCKLPRGYHTEMLSWESTGKFSEINLKKTPKMGSIGEIECGGALLVLTRMRRT